MRMFLTPDKTFSVSLEWSDEHNTFLAVPAKAGETVFDLATPDETMAHEQYFGLNAVPNESGFMDTHKVIWGAKNEKGEHKKGLVRAVHNAPAGFVPTPRLTIALARICREECGMSARLVDPSAPRLSAEGNSDSPSGSGSGSTPTTAGSAEIPSTDRP